MKTSNLLIIGFGGLLVWEWFQKGVSAATVQLVINGFKFKSINDLQISFLVQNVGNAPININSMSGQVSVNGNFIGNVSYFPAQHIPVGGNSQAPITVDFQPSFLSLPSAIKDLLQTGSNNFTLTVTGNLNYDGIVLPFTVEE